MIESVLSFVIEKSPKVKLKRIWAIL
jgi:hypothetical protein